MHLDVGPWPPSSELSPSLARPRTRELWNVQIPTAKITNIGGCAGREKCHQQTRVFIIILYTGGIILKIEISETHQLCAPIVSLDFQQSHPRHRDQQAQWLRRVSGSPEGLHRRGKVKWGRGGGEPTGFVFISVTSFPSFFHF